MLVFSELLSKQVVGILLASQLWKPLLHLKVDNNACLELSVDLDVHHKQGQFGVASAVFKLIDIKMVGHLCVFLLLDLWQWWYLIGDGDFEEMSSNCRSEIILQAVHEIVGKLMVV